MSKHNREKRQRKKLLRDEELFKRMGEYHLTPAQKAKYLVRSAAASNEAERHGYVPPDITWHYAKPEHPKKYMYVMKGEQGNTYFDGDIPEEVMAHLQEFCDKAGPQQFQHMLDSGMDEVTASANVSWIESQFRVECHRQLMEQLDAEKNEEK